MRKPKYVFYDRTNKKWRGQFNHKNLIYRTRRYPTRLGALRALNKLRKEVLG